MYLGNLHPQSQIICVAQTCWASLQISCVYVTTLDVSEKASKWTGPAASLSERYSVQYVSAEPAVDKYLINSIVQSLLNPIV